LYANIDRLFRSDYLPISQDILHSQLRTTGLSETQFELDDLTYNMLDISEQLSESKKWVHCFEGVHCLLFVASLSGYDECFFAEGASRPYECELPLRYALPCQHWMLGAYELDVSIPLSLIHPRWLLDGPPYLTQDLIMYFEPSEDSENITPVTYEGQSKPAHTSTTICEDPSSRYSGDVYYNHGQNLIMRTALEAVAKQKSLKGPDAEKYSSVFQAQVQKLNQIMDQEAERSTTIPSVLPDALKSNKNLRPFANTNSRGRAMTGREAAEAGEKTKEKKRKRIEKERIADDKAKAKREKLKATNKRPARIQELLSSGGEQSTHMSSSDDGGFISIEDDVEGGIEQQDGQGNRALLLTGKVTFSSAPIFFKSNYHTIVPYFKAAFVTGPDIQALSSDLSDVAIDSEKSETEDIVPSTRRSGRVIRKTRILASQESQEAMFARQKDEIASKKKRQLSRVNPGKVQKVSQVEDYLGDAELDLED
jgi:hypothetical protein